VRQVAGTAPQAIRAIRTGRIAGKGINGTMRICVHLVAVFGFCCAFVCQAAQGDDKDQGETVQTTEERRNDVLGAHGLTLPAPILKWDDAIPLGNGLTGGLLWGEKSNLRLSLDRGDLWDERTKVDFDPARRTFATFMECYKNRDRETWDRVFLAANKSIKWTKIPGGRLEITLPQGLQCESFHLDFEKATGKVTLSDGTRVEAFFPANQPVALLRLPKGARFKLIRPNSINLLGYPAPGFSDSDNEVAYTQKTTESFNYAVAAQWKEIDGQTMAIIAITNSKESDHPLALARERIAEGFKAGWDTLYAAHLKWWKEFYNTSSVTIPLPRLQHHYNLVKYFYGAASRAHAKPMPLQGVWTADADTLPPWRGDYHNDLNTQMSYVAWQAAGLVDSGMAYINYYWDTLPQFRKYAREFFGVDGAMVPGVMTLGGQVMGGWLQYCFQPTAGLWNGHAAYRHWKVTRDEKFLAERAYPWLAEVAGTVFSLCREEKGVLKLPYSCSPEWDNDKWSAFLEPNSNFDQALLLWSSAALEEMATALGKTEDAGKWAALHAKLAPLKFDEKTGALMVAEGVPFNHPHRHFSHTLAIHPLGILNVEQSEDARKAVRASVRQILDQSHRGWTGYSFTWAAALAARAGFADDALRHLVDFERAFVARNGFHLNGDQTRTILPNQRRRGSRAFTLEGNFLFMDAIHEMVMQSFDGTVRIFPTMPGSWKDAEFKDLRAEGGFKVSAERVGGVTKEVRIEATCNGVLKLRDPFPGWEAQWGVKPQREGDRLLFDLKAGDVVSGTRP